MKNLASLLDTFDGDNCEMLLLPDGWYHNGCANKLSFKERMKFLQDIANMIIKGEHNVELYIGCSGMQPDEFLDVTVKCENLTQY